MSRLSAGSLHIVLHPRQLFGLWQRPLAALQGHDLLHAAMHEDASVGYEPHGPRPCVLKLEARGRPLTAGSLDRRESRKTQKVTFGRLFPNCSFGLTGKPVNTSSETELWAESGA